MSKPYDRIASETDQVIAETSRIQGLAIEAAGPKPEKHPPHTIKHNSTAFGGYWEWVVYADGRVGKKVFRQTPEVEVTAEYLAWELRFAAEKKKLAEEIPSPVIERMVCLARCHNGRGLHLTHRAARRFEEATGWNADHVVKVMIAKYENEDVAKMEGGSVAELKRLYPHRFA